MELRIPQLGVTMTEGVIAEWFVADGDTVTAGDVLYTLETDKTQTEVESPSGGALRIIGEIEVSYPVGTVVAKLD
jgi:pyruvate/2-oxoglutarate dehydrogenase complex dihydrolipoamide acyltransferase (E2) component